VGGGGGGAAAFFHNEDTIVICLQSILEKELVPHIKKTPRRQRSVVTWKKLRFVVDDQFCSFQEQNCFLLFVTQ
jgi:hypothetical protein